MLGNALSAQIIKTEKVKVDIKPVAISVSKKNDAIKESTNNNSGSKLIRKYFILKTTKITAIKRNSKK